MPRRNGLGTKSLKVIMLHSIEDFCKKIQSIADQAKRLKELSQKSDSNAEIQSMVEDIQMQCRNVGNEGKNTKLDFF